MNHCSFKNNGGEWPAHCVAHTTGAAIWNTLIELIMGTDEETVIFSNTLDFQKASKIQEYYDSKIKCAFGIGTNFTNDTDFAAENIVMKMTKFRLNNREPWLDVIKISDDAGKHMGNEKTIEIEKYQLGIED